LEIRNFSGAVKAKRAALVREDGQIVDLDGVSPVGLYGLVSGTYYMTVRHRNHLGVRSSTLRSFTTTALGSPATQSSYDFTTAQSQAYQNPAITSNAAMVDLGEGRFGLWGGNANGNSTSRATGGQPLNDYLYLLNTLLNGNFTVIVNNLYTSADLNLDGSARATGGQPLNDYLFLLNAVLAGNFTIIRSEHQ
jgi:hypothetical protein